MVALLDLPTEILEMIFSLVFKAANAIIHTPPMSTANEVNELSAILSLRLVLSRIRALVDPLVFRGIMCGLDDKRDTGGSRRPQRRGVLALLDSPSQVCKSVESMIVLCTHGKSTRQSPYRQEKLQTVLGHTSTSLEYLCFHPTDEGEQSSSMPLYTDLSIRGFPNLQMLVLSDIAFVFSLLEVVVAAPSLEIVTINGRTALPEAILDKMAATVHVPKLSRRGSTGHPLVRLRLDNCGAAWTYHFLARAKLHAQFVDISTDGLIWSATPDEQVAGLSYMADCQLFERLTVKDVDRNSSPLDPAWAKVKRFDHLHTFLVQALSQRHALCKQLHEVWQGKGIIIVYQKPLPCNRIVELLQAPDTRLTQLVEFGCVKSQYEGMGTGS